MPVNPSDSEQEYFLKLELEKLREAQKAHAAKQQEAEKQKQKELHWMRCPKCGCELKEIEYRTIKVDYCGGCGGSFFDSGEITSLLKLEGEQHVLGKFLGLFKK